MVVMMMMMMMMSANTFMGLMTCKVLNSVFEAVAELLPTQPCETGRMLQRG